MKSDSNSNAKHMNQLRYQFKTFHFAFSGIQYFFSNEIKAILHFIAAILVILVGIYLKISHLEWAVISLTIGLVFLAEIINTAIENVVDLISPAKNRKAKIIKDVGAGGVLMASFTAVAVAIFIFLPKIIKLFS